MAASMSLAYLGIFTKASSLLPFYLKDTSSRNCLELMKITQGRMKGEKNQFFIIEYDLIRLVFKYFSFALEELV